MSGVSERLQAQVTILQKELNELKAIHCKRTKRASRKRHILKGTSVITTETIHKALQEAEKATRSKKGNKGKNVRKEKKDKISSESE